MEWHITQSNLFISPLTCLQSPLTRSNSTATQSQLMKWIPDSNFHVNNHHWDTYTVGTNTFNNSKMFVLGNKKISQSALVCSKWKQSSSTINNVADIYHARRQENNQIILNCNAAHKEPACCWLNDAEWHLNRRRDRARRWWIETALNSKWGNLSWKKVLIAEAVLTYDNSGVDVAPLIGIGSMEHFSSTDMKAGHLELLCYTQGMIDKDLPLWLLDFLQCVGI